MKSNSGLYILYINQEECDGATRRSLFTGKGTDNAIITRSRGQITIITRSLGQTKLTLFGGSGKGYVTKLGKPEVLGSLLQILISKLYFLRVPMKIFLYLQFRVYYECKFQIGRGPGGITYFKANMTC